MYGLNAWSKATFHWPSRPQKSKAPVSAIPYGTYITVLSEYFYPLAVCREQLKYLSYKGLVKLAL
jgi:hypothetical protein